MESQFRKVYHGFRNRLSSPDDFLFIVHTPMGTITTFRLHYDSESNYVFFEGHDENKKHRLLGFSESAIASFGLEFVPKPSIKKGAAIGFKPNESNTEEA